MEKRTFVNKFMNKYVKTSISGSVKAGSPKQIFKLDDRQAMALENVAQLVLATAMASGIVLLSAVAPNVFSALDKAPWRRKTYRRWDSRRSDQQRRIAKSIYYLKAKGYVQLAPEGRDFKLKITQKGRKKIRMMQFKSLSVPAGKKWDGHWWLVLADVPSDPYRSCADSFRKKIRSMGFYPLQRTVWVYPFDPRDEVDFISSYFKINPFVTVMEAVSLDPEDERKLRDNFKERAII